MILKLEKASKDFNSPLEYSERKVGEKNASIVAFANLTDTDPDTVRTEFERRERLNIRTRNTGFHMSVNPSETDFENHSKEDDIRYIHEVMSMMGYGEQPYLIYEHTDIDRHHYHVVASRIRENGKKVNDSKEIIRLDKTRKHLNEKYNYEEPTQKKEKMSMKEEDSSKPEITPSQKKPKDELETARETAERHEKRRSGQGCTEKRRTEEGTTYPHFRPGQKNKDTQVYEILSEALKYRFTTFNQFRAILNSMGLEITATGNTGNTKLTFQGMNSRGKTVTPPMTEKALKIPYGKILDRRLEIHDTEDYADEKRRIAGIASSCLKYATSEQHFARMLAKKNIHIQISRTSDGKLFGATFVDHVSKSAFKCSELGNKFTLNRLSTMESEKWKANQTELPTDQSDIPKEAHTYRYGKKPRSEIILDKIFGVGRSTCGLVLSIILTLLRTRNRQLKHQRRYR